MTPLLEVRDVRVRFPVRGERQRWLTAVDGVTLSVRSGEIVGLVGESGCGKSTLARAIVGLERPERGQVVIDGQELTALRGAAYRAARRQLQLIFQDPDASLSPRWTVRETLDEPLRLLGMKARTARGARARELLDLVGLPAHFADRVPRALSGGQRQRVAIARALASEPRVLVCDEPVSALDVSIRAQIMNVLLELVRELDLGCLFIAHDLGLVRQACHRVAVMYLGRLVELGPSAELWSHPQHPYTHALLSAVPEPDPRRERQRQRIVLAGDVPSPAAPPSGCTFHTRCPVARADCSSVVPELASVGPTRSVACHYPGSSQLESAA